jgi:hypothetical protein
MNLPRRRACLSLSRKDPQRKGTLIMLKIAAGAITLLFLASCAQVGQKVVLDAGQAQAMAEAFAKIDPSASSRIPCYQAWGVLGGNVAGQTQPGILSTVEGTLEVQATTKIPACQAILATVITDIIKKFPPGNLLP